MGSRRMTKPVFRFPVTFEWIGGIHIIQIKTRNFVLILMGLLLIILFTCCFFSNKYYYSTMNSMKPTSLQYKGTVLFQSFSADYVDRLTTPKRSIYWGEINETENRIEITVPGKATIMIFPNDQDSVLMTYMPHHGIKRNYKLSGYGDFNRHLEILYKQTQNEVFNETIELPKTK